ncbi:MAG: hypothetical protein WCT26_02100 [Candidatus Buchananbacteria bacterium]|jgi:hypothetical protein
MKLRFSIILPLLLFFLNLGIFILISVGGSWGAIIPYIIIDLPGLPFLWLLMPLHATVTFGPFLAAGVTIIFYLGIGLLIDNLMGNFIKKKAKIISKDPDEFPR